MEQIKKAIQSNYMLYVMELEKTAGGWTSAAFVVKTTTGNWFAKVYDKRRPSVQPWIARMDRYMPTVLWLYEHTPLRHWMVAPLRTESGAYKVESSAFILLVFPMLTGTTLCDSPLTGEQIRQLAVILANLHQCGNQAPVSMEGLQEDYTLPFFPILTAALEEGCATEDLRDMLCSYESAIKTGMEVLGQLAATQTSSSANNVLCHADIHGWNLMWTDKVILIDWEGLCLAPAEADLFAFTEGFFFDYAREEFLTTYRRIRKEYVEDNNAMEFYRLRRRMEDIAEFLDRLAQDKLSPEETRVSLAHMERECAALSQMLRRP